MSDIYRTPDARFTDLRDFPYQTNYVEDLADYDGLRMHYLDEGPRDAARVYLCLHGEPTWSYLYRKMLPVFVRSGGRVVAPDLFGFGRSDKPSEETYSFDFHRQSLLRLVERLALSNITIVCQDWGGLLGLTLPLEIGDRIGGVIAMNTILVTAEMSLPDAFADWKQWAAAHPDMDIGAAMQFIDDTLPMDVLDAYRAPFPDERSKAGPRSFPKLVPISEDMAGVDTARKAVAWWQNEWRGEALVACGVHDRILSLPVMQLLASWIKNCPPVLEVGDAGHFCQERGEIVAKKYVDLYVEGE
ncbi:MAG: haloalkane dehalogenase [Gammaproteobacteria bacterium]|nr:haloalkane dehalogenase [Gammaproteobacteria bacterium]